MSIGNLIKAKVDAVRSQLGAEAVLVSADGSAIDLGRCSFRELSAEETVNSVGPDWADEIALGWAIIETPAEQAPHEGDQITLNGRDWLVRRVSRTLASDVVIGHRCLCVAKVVT